MTLDVLPVKVVTMIEIFEALLRHDRAQRLEARCTAWPSISNKIADAGGPEISQAVLVPNEIDLITVKEGRPVKGDR